MDCSCKGKIYVITCNGCQENYIGQTGDFRKRVTVHKQQIKEKKNEKIPLSGQIPNCAKDKKLHFYIFPLYNFIHASTKSGRTIKDYQLI